MIAVEEHGEITKVFQIVEWTKTSVQRPTETGWYRIDLGGYTTKAYLTQASSIAIDLAEYEDNLVWPDNTPLTSQEIAKLVKEKDTVFYFPRRLRFLKFERDKNIWVIYENRYEPLYWAKEDNDGETEIGPSFFVENELVPIHKID